MSFVSQIGSREIIIGDHNAGMIAETTHVAGQRVSRGLVPRDKSIPQPFMQAFDIPLIPRSEWTDRIEEMERTKSRLSDIAKQGGVQVKSQGNLPFCWVFAATSCVEYTRAVEGKPYVSLSPSSVGGPIKNYKSQGGWSTAAVEYMLEHGVVPTELWPDCGNDRKYDTDATRTRRRDFLPTEWYLLPDGRESFDAMMTCLFLRMPVAIGLNWWSHAILAVDPLVLSPGKFGVRIQNSWGESWSDGGFGILNESKGSPDDSCCVRVMM